MPMVLVDRKVDGLNSDMVGLNNPQAVEMALAHLEQRGYRDVLLVTEPYDGTSSRIESGSAVFRRRLHSVPG